MDPFDLCNPHFSEQNEIWPESESFIPQPVNQRMTELTRSHEYLDKAFYESEEVDNIFNEGVKNFDTDDLMSKINDPTRVFIESPMTSEDEFELINQINEPTTDGTILQHQHSFNKDSSETSDTSILTEDYLGEEEEEDEARAQENYWKAMCKLNPSKEEREKYDL